MLPDGPVLVQIWSDACMISAELVFAYEKFWHFYGKMFLQNLLEQEMF